MQTGINLIPDMPADEVIGTVQAAEELGYDYCLFADEGFMPDVYIALGAAASRTSRIRLGPVTNGYTRHPAVTAVAMATLNQLSGGRAVTVLVAGGSLVLKPMNIPLEAPLSVVRDSIEVMRRLWTGEAITWQGGRFQLDSAQISLGAQNIPIWMAVRGPKMLQLAGEMADGVVLMIKPDVGPALQFVEQGRGGREGVFQRIYLDKPAYTPEMLENSTNFFGHVVMDTPERQLRTFLSDPEIQQLRQAYQSGGPDAVTRLVTPEMIRRYKVAGTPAECTRGLAGLIHEHQLDVFLLNITSGGLEANIQMMRDVLSIVNNTREANTK